MEMLEKAQRMLERYPLCDHCLGRQFAFLGYNMDNQDRGKAIKIMLTMMGHQMALAKDKKGITLLKVLATSGSFSMAVDILRKMKRRVKKAERCFLCEGRFETLQTSVDRIVEMLKGYEYETFVVGVKLPTEIDEREDEFKAEFEFQHSESIRNEFSRIVGKMISQATSKSVEYMKPQIAIIVNPFTEEIELQVNSLFIMGRYRKLVRGIPQSKWICRKCRGRGCERCNWTGKMYPESVEELIAKPVLKRTLGEEASFHGAGREDIDARMLGRGRPFIIEIKKPRRRLLDLSELEQAINAEAEGKIEVASLKFADREMVRNLKQLESTQKVYRVLIEFEREISDEEIGKLKESLTGAKILQRTPSRVLHRRADRTREKYIYATKVKKLTQKSIEMRIRCQGGLYIKELVTGDDGRTDPNISMILNVEARPVELDVLNILMKGRLV